MKWVMWPKIELAEKPASVISLLDGIGRCMFTPHELQLHL
jgi:hypothetical protein